jgi:hypothetical protein
VTTVRAVGLVLLVLLALGRPAAAGHPWSAPVLTIDA